jgi:riboflavin kinase/FMN adenylyltransferase
MRVFDDYKTVAANLRGAVVAVGNFDGVHRGHQAVIGHTHSLARKARRPVGVMMFEPHPREFFEPAKPIFRLTPLPRKLELFRRLGVDVAIVLPFNRDLASLDADRFIAEVLVAGLGVSGVVIGYDFHFGRGRGGTPAVMQAAGLQHGFDVTVIDAVGEDDTIYSSSAIRSLLKSGDVAGAAKLLGHRWQISGVVVGGAKRGTGMGFPTANIGLARGTELAHGIYAVTVHLDGKRHAGAAYLGKRPTFDNGEAVLEVFLLDFDGDLYGRTIGVEFAGFVRGDAKFDGMEALVVQMQRDCEHARAILNDIAANDPLSGTLVGA